MSAFLKKNFIILLAFALPIGLIAVVAAIAYLPSFMVSTKYDFVYMRCVDTKNHYAYRCDDVSQVRYSVVDGKLVMIPPSKPKDPLLQEVTYDTRIFLHDTEKNISREIPLVEAQLLTFNNLLTSPDGITVSGNYTGNAEFFPFFNSRSSYDYYLTEGNRKSRLNLIHDDAGYYDQYNFQFIGWILPGRN